MSSGPARTECSSPSTCFPRRGLSAVQRACRPCGQHLRAPASRPVVKSVCRCRAYQGQPAVRHRALTSAHSEPRAQVGAPGARRRRCASRCRRRAASGSAGTGWRPSQQGAQTIPPFASPPGAAWRGAWGPAWVGGCCCSVAWARRVVGGTDVRCRVVGGTACALRVPPSSSSCARLDANSAPPQAPAAPTSPPPKPRPAVRRPDSPAGPTSSYERVSRCVLER